MDERWLRGLPTALLATPFLASVGRRRAQVACRVSIPPAFQGRRRVRLKKEQMLGMVAQRTRSYTPVRQSAGQPRCRLFGQHCPPHGIPPFDVIIWRRFFPSLSRLFPVSFSPHSPFRLLVIVIVVDCPAISQIRQTCPHPVFIRCCVRCSSTPLGVLLAAFKVS